MAWGCGGSLGYKRRLSRKRWSMSIEYEASNYARNIARHGVPLRLAAALFEGRVIEWPEQRPDGGDARWIALGEIAGRVFVCVFTWQGKARRVVLLRKATTGEADAYHQG